jgi:serine/threonine-protein kinase
VSSARNADARSDQYALGVILYRCVTGALPFRGDALYTLLRAIMRGEYAPPRTLDPTIPMDFEAVLRKAMQRDRERRFSSVAHLGIALLPFASAGVAAQWGAALESILLSREPLEHNPSPVPVVLADHDTTFGGASRELTTLARRPSRRRSVVGGVAWACTTVLALLALTRAPSRAPASMARPSAPAEAVEPAQRLAPAATPAARPVVASAPAAAAAPVVVAPSSVARNARRAATRSRPRDLTPPTIERTRNGGLIID